MTASLAGSRVLVVEDEYFIAQDVTQALSALGGEVVGPVGTQQDALDVLGREPIDFAVLDINLHGEMSFEVADRLDELNVPYVFATGYERGTVPESLQHVPVWRKPFDTGELVASLATLRGKSDA